MIAIIILMSFIFFQGYKDCQTRAITTGGAGDKNLDLVNSIKGDEYYCGGGDQGITANINIVDDCVIYVKDGLIVDYSNCSVITQQ